MSFGEFGGTADGRRPVRPSGPPVRDRATSADVARRAGVSRSTVSHVLNGQVDRFTPETVARVHASAAELGYVRSAAGRALVRGRSDFVVTVLPYVTLTSVQDVIEGIAAELDDLGLIAAVHFSSPGRPDGTFARLRHMVETLRPVLILDLGGLSRAEARALAGEPLVLSEKLQTTSHEFDGNVMIGRLQAGHLVSRGCPAIGHAFLADRRDDPFGGAWIASIAEFCRRSGLPEPLQVDVPLEPAAARAAVAELMAGAPSGVGVSCSTDEVALAVTFAAVALGAQVPGDISVIGVGASAVGQLMIPRLTSVTFETATVIRPIGRAVAAALDRSEPGPVSYEPGDFWVLQGDTT